MVGDNSIAPENIKFFFITQKTPSMQQRKNKTIAQSPQKHHLNPPDGRQSWGRGFQKIFPQPTSTKQQQQQQKRSEKKKENEKEKREQSTI